MRDYGEFLAGKGQVGTAHGFAPLWLPDCLFDFQRHLVEWAVRRGRSAVLADCGLGKSLIELVWAENVVRKTNRPVLLLTPLAVAPQMVREAKKFGIDAFHSQDGSRPAGARVVVCNYERLHHFNQADFAGVACDESSCLKNYTGRTRKGVTRFLSKIQYRLLATATAAPNDYVELGTSSEALGELTHSDMLTRFFAYCDDKKQRREAKLQREAETAVAADPSYYRKLSYRVAQTIGQWRLKHHAAGPFWRWVCSWARACRMPSDLGFSDDGFILPPLEVNEHVIESGAAPGMLFSVPAVGLYEERQERRRTLERRCGHVAGLVDHDRSAAVWCQMNEEADRLVEMIPDAEQIAGRTPEGRKLELYAAFASGQLRVLVIKPKIGAWGLNWQHCAHVVTFVTHCYDADTELLTADGWKTFDKVGVGDEVGTVNPDTRFFEWQRATDHVWSPYSGEMIRFAGRSYDLMVTPNHRMWSMRDPNRYPASAGAWEVHTADELAATYRRQFRRFQSAAAGWNGACPKEIVVPSDQSVDYTRARTRQIGSIPVDVFAALAGWYLSEGCVITKGGQIDGRIVICQTDKHPAYRDRIIGALKATGLPVNSNTKDIYVCNKELACFLAKEFGLRSANLRIPRWVKDWPAQQLRILWDAIMDGDGMHSGGVLHGLKSTSPRLIADCQEIGFKLGISTTDRSAEGQYLGIRNEHNYPSIAHPPERVPYSGMVGCVTVPNGLLVVRRSGHAVVSGNSYEQYYQLFRRCWRFGQKNRVRLDVVATEGEVRVVENLRAKARRADVLFCSLVEQMRSAQRVERENPYTNRTEVPEWLSV